MPTFNNKHKQNISSHTHALAQIIKRTLFIAYTNQTCNHDYEMNINISFQNTQIIVIAAFCTKYYLNRNIIFTFCIILFYICKVNHVQQTGILDCILTSNCSKI